MGIDSVQDASTSDGDKVLEMPKVEDKVRATRNLQLGPEDARLYRGLAAWFNCLAPDRSDIGF